MLDNDRQALFQAVSGRVDARRLRRRLQAITAIASPTGNEETLARFVAAELDAAGITAHLQFVSEGSANVYAVRRGCGAGPSLLLYAPMDTHLEADPAIDLPWAGRRLRPDMAPCSPPDGEHEDPEAPVIGLGAANPKGMVASLIEAFIAIHEADLPLEGDVLLGLAGGGMPLIAKNRGHRGLSDGAYHLLTRGVTADFAIVLKPYNQVYHEEPGLCWFKVRVWGTLGYAGTPRGRDGYRSSIVPAARLILALEKWLEQYPERNAAGQVRPQGWITAVRGGWEDKPAFPAAATEITLDLRCSPHTSPAEVKSQFGRAIEEIIAGDPSLEVEWEMTGSYPGASTDPENWIIRSARRAWEAVEGMPHPEPVPMSGQTDISLLRNLGIPTARFGWQAPAPHVAPELCEGMGGLGVAYVPYLIPAVKKVLYCVVDSCTRDRQALFGIGA